MISELSPLVVAWKWKRNNCVFILMKQQISTLSIKIFQLEYPKFKFKKILYIYVCVYFNKLFLIMHNDK
jgi:hypothetical protein